MPTKPTTDLVKVIIWVGGSLLAGSLPMFARALVSTMFADYPIFDIKDALFLGVAMNISNVNLLGEKDKRRVLYKVVAIMTSVLLLFILTFALGAFQVLECQEPGYKLPVFSRNIMLALTSGSVIISFIATMISANFINAK